MLRSVLLVVSAGATLAACASPDLANSLDLSTLEQADSVVVGSTPLCPLCTVRMDTLALLVNLDDPSGLSGLPLSWAVDSNGRYIVAMVGPSVFVYDHDGTLVDSIGRVGGGPGEYQNNVQVLAGSGDSIFIVDATDRMNVYGPDGAFVRTARLQKSPRYGRLALHPNGTVLSADPWKNEEGAVNRVRLLDGSGEEVAVFDPASDPGDVGTWTRLPTVGPDSLFWVATFSRWEIHAWTSEGEIRKHFTADPPWEASADRPSATEALRVGTSDPGGETYGVAWDEIGLMYVISVLPTDRFDSEAIPWRDRVDTYVEVIDPRSGMLVATAVFDQIILPAPNGDGAYEIVETAEGHRRLQILKLSTTGVR